MRHAVVMARVVCRSTLVLPSARAWVISAKHHLEASQSGVWMMTTAWDFSTSR